MRATDAWAAAIRAGGRARRGAKMVVLDASHPDILEFIDAKAREEDRGRALLAAGYPLQEVVASLAFQHANHSVRVTDELMRVAIDGADWALRAVTTGEVLETLPAAGLATRREVQIVYAIGVAKPVSVTVETFGTRRSDAT
jgi:ribonucleoside-diphosphate reductase alpha chain